MISVSIEDKGAVLKLQKLPGRVTESLVRAMLRVVIGLRSYVVGSKLSGQVLKARTGNLARSAFYREPQVDGNTITGVVGAGSAEARYGEVHEFGGTFDIPAHTVREHLRTVVFGRRVAPFSVGPYQVGAHSATFPERSFLRTALAEQAGGIRAELERAVAEAIQS